MMLSRRNVLFGGSTLLSMPLAAPLLAQTWAPTRPLRIIIPFTAGGSTDLLVRTAQQGLSEELGQTLVIENRPGASTIIGTQEVANAPADGYTMLLIANSFAANITLRPKLPYNSLRDFAPISRAGAVTNVLLVNAKLGDNFTQFLAAARASKEGLTYGSYGIGTTNHLAAAQLCERAQFKGVHVPYNGAARPILDLLAGRLDFLFVNIPDATTRRANPNIRLLAVSRKERTPQLPAVPTLEELGYGDILADSWFSIVTRSDVPAPARERLEAAWSTVLHRKPIRDSLEENGFMGVGESAKVCREQIDEYTKVYAEVIRANKITVE